MARHGKIARLPREIRDELNRRLDDGAAGVDLVTWLNGLPQVKEILETQFEGRPINEDNLTQWKQGGFADWRAQQDAQAFIEQFMPENNELAGPLTRALMTHYAAALYRSNGDAAEQPRDQVKRLSKSLRDVVRLRRCELASERTEIQRKSVEIQQQKTDDGQSKKFFEMANDPKVLDRLTPKMSWEEKARIVREVLFPKKSNQPDPNNRTESK